MVQVARMSMCWCGGAPPRGVAAVPGPALARVLGHAVEKLPLGLEFSRLGKGRGRRHRRHRRPNGLCYVVEVRAIGHALLHPPVVHVFLEGRGAGAVGAVGLHLLNPEGHCRLDLGVPELAVHADDAHAVNRGFHRRRPTAS